MAAAVLILAGTSARAMAGNVIFVTTLDQKVDAAIPGCSLQEAIYSANFDANTAIVYGSNGSPTSIVTECVPAMATT